MEGAAKQQTTFLLLGIGCSGFTRTPWRGRVKKQNSDSQSLSSYKYVIYAGMREFVKCLPLTPGKKSLKVMLVVKLANLDKDGS